MSNTELISDLETTRITLECILVALIWPIQLLIYPKFSQLKKQDQARVHLHYTLLITAIISPVIVTHFAILTYEYLHHISLLTLLRLLTTSIAITSTIFLLAPLHLAIILFGPSPERFHKINQRNWIRTITWTISLTLSLIP